LSGGSVTDTEVGSGRRRGRSRGLAGERSHLPEQRPFAQPRMRYAPTQVVSADELEAIHDASLRILAEIGMNFLDPQARELLARAGADVVPGEERVRFDPAMVVETIATCPSQFRLHSWNAEHTVTLGGDVIAFGSVGSPPNYVDLKGVRAPGT